MPPVSSQLTIKNQLGLHARPAAVFVENANKFQSDIVVQKGAQRVNGKSIMGLMMLAAACGDKITLEIEGVDAAEALDHMADIIENNFFE